MRVIVTGSRAWDKPQIVWDALNEVRQEHGPFVLMHGDCATGADFYAHHWFEVAGRHEGCEEIRYPAAWEAAGKAAGPERNKRMVAAGADLVLAFPLPKGSGTQHTIWLAEQAGIPVQKWGPGV